MLAVTAMFRHRRNGPTAQQLSTFLNQVAGDRLSAM
jgi:hypothetical protein